MEFNESMIGKQIKEIDSGDLGIVVCQHELEPDTVWVDWGSGHNLWISLDEVVFTDNILDVKPFDEITINGKRYKLTQIE